MVNENELCPYESVLQHILVSLLDSVGGVALLRTLTEGFYLCCISLPLGFLCNETPQLPSPHVVSSPTAHTICGSLAMASSSSLSLSK